MTEKNTEIMRDVFRLLSEFETPPEPSNWDYWKKLISKAHALNEKWNGTALCVYLTTAVCDAMAAEQKRIYPEQIKMDV